MKWLPRFFLLALLLAGTGAASAQLIIKKEDQRDRPKVLQAFRAVVEKPSASTVGVLADGKQVALGTIVEADGWVLTKWSEIRDHRSALSVKLKDGKALKAEIVGVKDDKDAGYDLALLKVGAEGLAPIRWRPSKEATVGRWVASPGTGADPVGIGVVSVGTRKFKLGDQPPKILHVNAGYLGISLDEGPGGAKVLTVVPKGAAEKAGLKVSDLIYEANGKKILDSESLINTIGGLKAGDDVLIKAKRGEEDLEVKATLAKRPKELSGNPQETMGAKLSNRRGGFPAILQHDSALRPEDCGGPLVDLDGLAVGINIARAGRTETYAIPSEDVLALLEDLKSGKLAPKNEVTVKAPPVPKTIGLVLRVASNLNAKDKVGEHRKGCFMKAYDVYLAAGTTYFIEADGDGLRAVLVLADAKGNKLAEDGDDPNPRLVYRAPSEGLCRIIVTSVTPNETGAYTLTVRTQPNAPGKTEK